MANKKNSKKKRTLGTWNKSRSKGTGHINPMWILNADWLISEN